MSNKIYNTEKQNERNTSFGHKALRFVLAVLSVFSFAAVVLFISYTYIGSPKEMMLKEKNNQYAQQLQKLNAQIEGLNQKLADIETRDDEIYRPFCNLEAIPAEVREVGFGGSDRYTSLQGYHNSSALIATAQRIDRLGRKLSIQRKSLKEVDKLTARQKDLLASIPAIQPVSKRDLNYISSYFGFRDHPKLHRWIKHTGVDYAAPKGSPVYATGNGVVEQLKKPMTHYGKVIVINHGYGYESLYAHLDKKIVQPGDTVKRGQIIGYVGRTGRVTGVHLHYEVLKDGRYQNPTKYYNDDLNADEYDRMIETISL